MTGNPTRRPSPSYVPPAFYLLSCLCLGIYCGRILPDISFPLPFSLSLVFVAVTIFLTAKLKLSPLYFASQILFFYGLFTVQAILYPALSSHHISNYISGHKVTLKAKVTGFTKHYTGRSKIQVDCKIIQIPPNLNQKVTGTVLLTVYGKGELPQFGDMIRIETKLKPFRNFANPGGFDYVTFMKLKQIHAAGYASANKLFILPRDTLPLYDRFMQHLETDRINFHNLILSQTRQTHPQAGLILSALVTGKKENISAQTRDLFSKTGISHLLAISGLHLSIVALGFYVLFHRLTATMFPIFNIKGLAKKTAWAAAIFPVTFYALFSGFSPSTQRAYIMIVAIWIALMTQKDKDLFSTLCMAGTLILLINSAALFSVSFQLSFAAVFFIIGGMVLFKKITAIPSGKFYTPLLSMIAVTILAGLGTFPLTAHYFHVASHVQVFTNILAIPFIGFIIVPLGFCAFLLSLFSPLLAAFLIDGCTVLLFYIINIAQALSNLPYTWSIIPSFKPAWIWLYYLIAISLFFFLLQAHRKAVTGVAIGSVILGLIIFTDGNKLSGNPLSSQLVVSILDVGQGNAAVIRSPKGHNILIDGGGFSDTSRFDTGRMIVAPYLWSQNIRHIDTIILTHPESDHLNGILFILEHFNVKTLIKNMDESDSTNYRKLVNICRQNNICVTTLDTSVKSYNAGDLTFEFFLPATHMYPSDFNNRSLVAKLVYHQFSMLFTGDILHQRERFMISMSGEKLLSDILLAPHHGSNTSSTKFFLDHVQPKGVVISCGFKNRYGFPHPDVLKRYMDKNSDIYRTDIHGAVTITTGGQNYQVHTVKGG